MQPASPTGASTDARSPEPGGIDPTRLIADHQAGVWRYLRSLGCEPALADDLTQETFLAVLQRPLQDLGPAAVAAYLRRIAYNLVITNYRRSGRTTVVDNLEEIDTAWQRLADDDNGEAMLEALRGCLAGLTERARRALEMRFAINNRVRRSQPCWRLPSMGRKTSCSGPNNNCELALKPK